MAKQIDEVWERESRIEEGTYIATVERTEKRKTPNGKPFRIWTFWIPLQPEGSRRVRILLFPGESKELLLSLGGVEVQKNKIEWDDEEVIGRRIRAYFHYQKDNDGKERLKLKNCESAEDGIIELDDDFVV
ncbi:MAG: hypothetical protein DDT23_00954 [candidate division WS2 bacterium]|nr:hypothetical protein [Candidatus Lithacetigena glycinireducens]